MHDDMADRWRAILAEPLNLRAYEPLSSTISLEVGACSVGGKARAHNTDHYLVMRLGRAMETLLTSLATADLPPRFEEYAYALLIADGLGEHVGGARASRLALSALAHLAVQYGQWNVRVAPHTSTLIAEQGDFFYRRLNELVLQASRAHAELGEMATSLTALYVVEDDLFFTHIGHSRAYLFRDGVLIQLTATHTLDSQRAGSRPMPLERAKRDSRHVVTEAVGGRSTMPGMEVEHIKLMSGDRLLMCSNGLTDIVSDEEIATALAARRRPADESRWLADLAAESQQDDVTVVVADYRMPRS